jgi:hypothetical protein
MVFFIERKGIIIGSEFNFYGPRVPGFKRYLLARAPGVCPPVTIKPLFRQDVVKQIAALEDVRLFDLAIQNPTAIHSARIEAAPFFPAIRETAKNTAAEEIEVVLRSKRYSRKDTLGPNVLKWLKSWIGREEVPGEISRLVIKGLDGETNQVETVDVLRTQFLSKQEILKEDLLSRALHGPSAYAAIEKAHSDLRNQLLQAAGVQP